MNIQASVDKLIMNLEGLKANMPDPTDKAKSMTFDNFFEEASAQLDKLTSLDVAPDEASALPNMSPIASTTPSFSTLQETNWIVDSQSEATRLRPNMREFMDATGASAADASEILYGVIGSNADLRDWSKIMASGSPIDAARAATRQLYNSDKEYALVNSTEYRQPNFDDVLNEHSLASKEVLYQEGNFAEIQATAETKQLMAVSSSGLLLRGAGSTQEQIERTAWIFGFDAPQIQSLV